MLPAPEGRFGIVKPRVQAPPRVLPAWDFDTMAQNELVGRFVSLVDYNICGHGGGCPKVETRIETQVETERPQCNYPAIPHLWSGL
jgi:hypothetical protein